MKKSKLIAGLSAAFVGVIALASCAGYVKSKDGVVLSYDGKEYTAKDLFNDDHSAAGAEAKFNAVYKVAVRQYFKDASEDLKKRIAKDTENKISGQKATAQSNADKNGTSYDTEWKKILDANGVEDEKGLYDKFEYDFQKEEFDEQFYENKFDVLKHGGKLDDTLEDSEKLSGYIPYKQPYHMKHILVKVGAAEKDYKTGEITDAQAIALSKVITELAEGKNFGEVAKKYSEDTGSGNNYGDLGIMDRDTSFVNEFKLGTYIYESYFSHTTTQPTAAEKDKYALKTAIDEIFGNTASEAKSYAEKIAKLSDPSNAGASSDLTGIGQIPFEAALMLGENDWSYTSADNVKVSGKGYAKIDDSVRHYKDITGEEIKAKYLPRNVIFNKYFNKHNIMVITPRRVSLHKANETEGTADGFVDKEGKKRLKDDLYLGVENEVFKDATLFPGFSNATKKNNDELTITMKANKEDGSLVDASKNVLRDNKGRIIFVFRSGTSGEGSYQGIHFVCIERSPFVGKEYQIQNDGTERTEPVTLDEYYTHYYPGQEGTTEGHKHPTYNDGTDKLTYVSWLNTTDLKERKARADSSKSKIKGYNPNLNTYIYRYLVKKGQLQFADNDLAKSIQNDISTWIDRKREGTDYDSKKTWNETWKTYYLALEEQTKERKPVEIATNDFISGTITEACVDAFTTWTKPELIKAAFGTGGVFHD